jgi:hypothetical protein
VGNATVAKHAVSKLGVNNGVQPIVAISARNQADGHTAVVNEPIVKCTPRLA